MKKIILAGFILLLGACQTVPAPPTPTSTRTVTPAPTATVEWFPPTPTEVVLPTSQPSPTQQVSMKLGEVIFRDEFQISDGWTVPQTENGNINIGGGEANIIVNTPGAFLVGTREKPDFTDFYVEITASPILCSGQDEYGFLFRLSGREKYYRFAMTCSGEVRLDRIIPGSGAILYPWTRSASVPAGAPSVSTIAVLAQADQLHIFVNGNLQTSVTDQQLRIGSFGIFARSVGDSAITISFSDLVVWEVLQE
jgi:hypothetical protein